MARWIRLSLPICCPGLDSKAHQLSFYQFIFELYHVEKMKTNQKETAIGPFFKKTFPAGVPPWLSGFGCAFYPGALGSSLKHTIYQFILCHA